MKPEGQFRLLSIAMLALATLVLAQESALVPQGLSVESTADRAVIVLQNQVDALPTQQDVSGLDSDRDFDLEVSAVTEVELINSTRSVNRF